MTWFDATTIDPAAGPQNFPIGNHLVIAKGSTRAATKDQSGGMLVFSLEIIDGPHKGFTGPYRLNMWNANAQSAEIAGKQLSALCHVTGVYRLDIQPPHGQDGQELFGKPFRILVEQQAPPNEKYTQIVGVLDTANNPPRSGQAPAQSAPPPAQQQPPAQQPAWAAPPQQAAPSQPPAQAAPPPWQGGAPAQQAAPPWQGAPPAQQQPPAQQPPWAAPAPGAAPPWAAR